uniref:putative type IX secretion system sortase PorU2 n=1 Tax=Rufibacter roseolus TaxID=2817375 RepID=UPI001B317114|nr:C25 family cysteine peptidase [Rufibacter roseolus]
MEGEADGSLDAGDFIEFYGEKNDGALDRELYKDPSANHINPYYSLYTDTAAYFLTWSSAPGKRMSIYNQEPAGLTPEAWHWQERIIFDNGEYTRGKRYGENYMSWMDAGEGFTGGSTNGYTYNLPAMASNIYSAGTAPKVEIAFVGANDNNHEVDVFVRPPSGPERLVGTIRLTGYSSLKQEFPLVASDFFTDGKLVLRLTAKNTSSRFRTVYFKTIYPQRNLIAGSSLPIKPSAPASTPLYYLFEGSAAANAIAYDLTNLSSIKRISGAVTGTQKGFVFPASFNNGILWSGANLAPSPAREVRFKSVVGNKANYLIISHQSLMVPSGTSTNPVRDYAAYRASAVGGGYDTLTMEVGQIYDQFFYGDKSSAAIRRFMKFMIANGKPQYLFLLGKGLESDNVNARNNPSSLAYKDLVPTGGTPGSDIFFTSDWEQGSYVPKVATGRVPASTPKEILDYLAKVKVHESLPYSLGWRKNMLHLVGSSDEEQRTLLSYMRGFERIAEGPWLGANVLTKIRSASGGLDTLNIARELNSGLSLITFFGHSSSTVSDLDIGRVSDVVNGYNNTGKYPMILMNGCNAGNTFTTGKSFGEDWLLTADKGAIAFLAHDSYGYPSLLNIFSSNFYTTAYGDSTYLSKPLGIQHQRAIELTTQRITGENATAMNMQIVMQADPALRLLSPAKADYAVASGGASIHSVDGSSLTASSEKFLVKLDVRNYGRVNLDSFYVSVNRKLENGTEFLYDSIKVAPIYYRDTLQIELESKTFEGAGVNTFVITLDHTDTIAELDETNNITTIEYFLSKSGVLALGPQEYSIVKNRTVKLIGQSTDLLTEPRGYYFEIDTVHTFKSAWKKSQVVQSALMPVWEVTLPENTVNRDSAVYFWRVRYETIAAEEDTLWATSSFRYIPGSPSGWSQKGFGQLQKAEKQKLVDNQSSKTYSFAPTFRIFELKGVGGAGAFGYPPYGIFLDNFKTIEADCGGVSSNMMAIILNDKTLEPYIGMPTTSGFICGTFPKFVYHFSNLTSAANLARLEQFLNSIPPGYHVAMMSMGNVPFSTFPENIKAGFRSLGSTLIDQLKTGDPFSIVGRKGTTPGTATEVGPNLTDPTPRNLQTIRNEKQVNSFESQGTVLSTLIGPAKEWKSLHHQLKLEASDSYQLDVIGVDQSGKETVLSSKVTASSLSLAGINASTYPYLRLKLTLKDETQRTAPQLGQWTVLYEGLPEGLMRPDLVGLEKYNKLSEQAANGEVNLQYAFHNISEVSFTDSLTVETTLFAENGAKTMKTFKVEPLQKEDTVFFTHKFSTINLKGANRLRVTVNPRILPEQNYFNNTLEVPFNVNLTAGMPPVLDVVFDGVRILDGDIVSPSPLISMVLKDNSRKIPITNPASMKVYLKKEDGDFEEIEVSTNPNIRWYPADDKNDFRVEYHPEKLADGKYTLEVQGFDALGQRAGNERYSVNFEVVNASSVTNFYPYPNPFSSKTRFVFTLTGSTVPDKMKIQIMTVTGKVIREVQKEELGPIKIGNNVSEFAWDGTDEYGERLANGVYLYRVVMDNGPEEMKHRYTEGDKAFKKGYGKIYILR